MADRLLRQLGVRTSCGCGACWPWALAVVHHVGSKSDVSPTRMAELEPGSPLFSEDGGGSSDDEAFDGLDSLSSHTSPQVIDGFNYDPPPDVDEDDFDAAYMAQTRRAMEAMFDRADAALYGEDPGADLPDDLTNRGQYQTQMRVVGVNRWLSELPAAEADGDSDDEMVRPSLGAAISSASQHCVIHNALSAGSCDLSVVGTALAPLPPDEGAAEAGACEEIFAMHGVLSEPIATHQDEAASGSTGAPPDDPSRVRHSEEWAIRRLGLPPREPVLDIPHNATHQLLAHLWQSVVTPHLAAIPLMVARMLLGMSLNPSPPPPQQQAPTPALMPGSNSTAQRLAGRPRGCQQPRHAPASAAVAAPVASQLRFAPPSVDTSARAKSASEHSSGAGRSGSGAGAAARGNSSRAPSAPNAFARREQLTAPPPPAGSAAGVRLPSITAARGARPKGRPP